jgi:hypothetical protein
MVKAYIHLNTPFMDGKKLSPLGRVTQRIETGRTLIETLTSGGVLSDVGVPKALHMETTNLAKDVISRVFLGKDPDTLSSSLSLDTLFRAFCDQGVRSISLSLQLLTIKRRGVEEDAEDKSTIEQIIFNTNKVLVKLGIGEVTRL